MSMDSTLFIKFRVSSRRSLFVAPKVVKLLLPCHVCFLTSVNVALLHRHYEAFVSLLNIPIGSLALSQVTHFPLCGGFMSMSMSDLSNR